MSNYYSSTASKMPSRYPANYPKLITEGRGAYIYDEQKRKYLDFVCSLGPIILGYKNYHVDNAVIKTIKDHGTIFSLSHPMEYKLASIICNMIPSAQSVRYAHNGKDVTEAAIRLARHITGRTMVLSFSYHGASDVFMACTKTDKGVPKCLKVTIKDFDYNDINRIKTLFDGYEIAAVIMEPHTIRLPDNDFLQFIRDICTQKGTVLIFDEVVSFPRYPGYSAQASFSVDPDLTCISKGMANGYPISALAGKELYMRELCDDGVFFSTTFGGNLIGVSAAIATLEFVVEHGVPTYLARIGNTLKIKDNPHVKLIGLPWRQFFECSNEVRQKICQEMLKKGVFFGVPIFFNWAMTEGDMTSTSNKLDDIISRLDKVEIEGKQITEVFHKR